MTGGAEHMNIWDEIYAGGGYGDFDPDEEVVELCKSLMPGRAIDVGAGEGRHSLWLASQGWRVDALDVSAVGLRSLASRAEERGLQVNCVVGSAAEHAYGDGAYRLVVSTGAALNFFKKSTGKEIIGSLLSALEPRGVLYLSVVTPDDPSNRRLRQEAVKVEGDSFFSERIGTWVTAYTMDDLRDCTRGCETLLACEKEIHDTHGTPHTHVMAYVAVRK
ncbi:MAG: methyltransferase domain-containing protein [Actinomycetota bacterium]